MLDEAKGRIGPGPGMVQEDREVLAARNAVAVVFALNGVAVGTWFARVPAARDALGLEPDRLGVLLLALSAGAVLALPTAGAVAAVLGVQRTVAVATALLSAGLALVGAGVGTWRLGPVVAVGLFALGYGSGTCEVAMNVQGAAVERRMGRTVLPRFHAGWSLGTVGAAAMAAGLTSVGMPVAAHLALVASTVLVGTLLAVRFFLVASMDDSTEGRRARPAALAFSAWRERRTILVGLLVLVVAFTEGTANDWIAVAFIDGHGISESAGAVVLGVFVGAMTLGRTFGTHALDRWGRVPVLATSLLLAALGAATVVLVESLPIAFLGAALWGLGASLGFPVGMSAAADDEERAAARVSVVAVVGYTAFLAGPPLVGFLGERVGTLRALLIVPLVLLPAVALTPATRAPRPSGR